MKSADVGGPGILENFRKASLLSEYESGTFTIVLCASFLLSHIS